MTLAESCDLKVSAHWCRKALELNPNNRVLMRSLLDYELTNRSWRSALRIFENLILSAPTRRESHQLLMEKFELYRTELDDQQNATLTAHRVLSTEPGHEVCFAYLYDRYKSDGDVEAIVDLLRRRNDRMPDMDSAFELGELLVTLNREDEAINVFRDILATAPQLTRAQKWIISLSDDATELSRMRRMLIPKASDDEEYRQLWSDELTYCEKMEDWLGVRSLFETVSVPPGAEIQFRPLFFKACKELSALDVVVDVLVKDLDFKQAGFLCLKSADLNHRALAYLESALEQDLADPEVFEALQALYRESKSWTELNQLLRRRLQRESNPTTRLTLQSQISELETDYLGAPRRLLSETLDWFSSAPSIELADKILKLVEQVGQSAEAFHCAQAVFLQKKWGHQLLALSRLLLQEREWRFGLESFKGAWFSGIEQGRLLDQYWSMLNEPIIAYHAQHLLTEPDNQTLEECSLLNLLAFGLAGDEMPPTIAEGFEKFFTWQAIPNELKTTLRHKLGDRLSQAISDSLMVHLWTESPSLELSVEIFERSAETSLSGEFFANVSAWFLANAPRAFQTSSLSLASTLPDFLVPLLEASFESNPVSELTDIEVVSLLAIAPMMRDQKHLQLAINTLFGRNFVASEQKELNALPWDLLLTGFVVDLPERLHSTLVESMAIASRLQSGPFRL